MPADSHRGSFWDSLRNCILCWASFTIAGVLVLQVRSSFFVRPRSLKVATLSAGLHPSSCCPPPVRCSWRCSGPCCSTTKQCRSTSFWHPTYDPYDSWQLANLMMLLLDWVGVYSCFYTTWSQRLTILPWGKPVLTFRAEDSDSLCEVHQEGQGSDVDTISESKNL